MNLKKIIDNAEDNIKLEDFAKLVATEAIKAVTPEEKEECEIGERQACKACRIRIRNEVIKKGENFINKSNCT